jgi:hypothetical protein
VLYAMLSMVTATWDSKYFFVFIFEMKIYCNEEGDIEE